MIRTLWPALLLMICACSSPPPAPVIDHSSNGSRMSLQMDGRYRVRAGDTLHAIAFHYGLDHRDIARWNGISRPYLIYPEQLLRMTPPPAGPAVSKTIRPAPGRGKTAASAPVKTARPVTANAPPKLPKPGLQPSDPESWEWPVKGRLVRSFRPNDPSRNGLDIAGREGQDIRAAASGTVVYSGNGLIAYGELIIIKHSDRMLSAYAHNRARLVKEGAEIRAGQIIAKLGKNDRNEAILHFEIRVSGRPVDPRKYLPVQ